MNIPLFISKIWQKDNDTFCIRWNDGLTQEFRLNDVQRNCPCAQCSDKMTGKPSIAEDVRAVVIRSVGHYGIRIQFTSGCSMGIYTFDRLRQLHLVKHA